MDRNPLTNRNTAVGAAAGVTLAVVGAVSALFLTLDQPADAAAPPAETIEFVDPYGNPVAAPASSSGAAEVVLVNPDGTLVDIAAASEPDAAYSDDEYGEEEYEEDEYGEEMDHDEPEYEDEDDDYEDGDEEYEDEDDDYEDGDEEYEDEDDDYEDGDEEEYAEGEDDD